MKHSITLLIATGLVGLALVSVWSGWFTSPEGTDQPPDLPASGPDVRVSINNGPSDTTDTFEPLNGCPEPPAEIANVAQHYSPRPAGSLTFNKDIAPIVFDRCSGCHRPDEAAPFSLLTYEDVAGRAQQIAEVTGSKYMPPWHPVDGYGEFADSRALTVEQIGMVEQWVSEGAQRGEGEPPALPTWTTGWKLGPPDLVIQMPEPYQLTGEGTDVFRNFVIPIPITTRQYVVGFEFRLANPKVVHHARMLLDQTSGSRERDEHDPTPGFTQLGAGSVDPLGHWLGWTPGKQPTKLPKGIAWILEPNTDLVLELHMLPSGKPEQIQASIGLYFSDQPPSQVPQVIRLGPKFMDIAPGAENHIVRDSYRLPVDVQVRSVYAHAHYLGKQVFGYAVLPDGTRRWLVRIDEWDFNWQDEYRFAEPIHLPRGSQLVMQFRYDNSENNIRNPHVPPKRIFYGQETFSEMSELWFQVLPTSRQQGQVLEQDYFAREERVQIDAWRQEVRVRPELSIPRFALAAVLANDSDLRGAMELYRSGLQIDPDNAIARNGYGVLLARQGKFAEAHEQFRQSVALDPNYYEAQVNLERASSTLSAQ